MRHACALLAALLLGCNRPEPVPADPLERLAPEFQAALRGNDWVAETRDHLLAVARRQDILSDAAAQADFALSLLHHRFHAPPAPAKIHMLVVPPEIFESLVAGAREKGANAVTLGTTIVVREGVDHVKGLDAICHEAVHAFCAVSLEPRPPLWLEEGLAVHWGRQLAAELHRSRGLEVKERTLEITGPDYDVTALTDYPTGPAQLQSFHARCAKQVGELEAATGPEGLPALVRAISREPARWRELVPD